METLETTFFKEIDKQNPEYQDLFGLYWLFEDKLARLESQSNTINRKDR